MLHRKCLAAVKTDQCKWTNICSSEWTTKIYNKLSVTAKCQWGTEPILEQSCHHITAAVTGILQLSWHQKRSKFEIVTTNWLIILWFANNACCSLHHVPCIDTDCNTHLDICTSSELSVFRKHWWTQNQNSTITRMKRLERKIGTVQCTGLFISPPGFPNMTAQQPRQTQ